MFKFMVLLEWVLFGITSAVMKLRLTLLKRGYINFYVHHTQYSVDKLEKIRKNLKEIDEKMFRFKKELFVLTPVVIITLLCLFMLANFLNVKMGLPSDIFLWMIGFFIVIPLFVIIFDGYIRRTILEMGKITSINKD